MAPRTLIPRHSSAKMNGSSHRVQKPSGNPRKSRRLDTHHQARISPGSKTPSSRHLKAPNQPYHQNFNANHHHSYQNNNQNSLARVQKKRPRSTELPKDVQVRKPVSRVKNYRAYYELVENPNRKQKKLNFQITLSSIPPIWYEFVPVGNPAMTSRCKELSRELGTLVYIVSTSKELDNELSVHMKRAGHHFHKAIVDEVRSHIHDYSPVDPEIIPETQEEINAQADAALRDLFPRMPNYDRQMIIDYAFRKGGTFNGDPVVGLIPDLPLSRRVQLATIAHIRHNYTRYDELLKRYSWHDARKAVQQLCLDTLIEWRGDDENGRDELKEILRPVIIITDSDDEDDGEDDDDEDDKSSPEGDATTPGIIDVDDEQDASSQTSSTYSPSPISSNYSPPSVHSKVTSATSSQQVIDLSTPPNPVETNGLPSPLSVHTAADPYLAVHLRQQQQVHERHPPHRYELTSPYYLEQRPSQSVIMQYRTPNTRWYETQPHPPPQPSLHPPQHSHSLSGQSNYHYPETTVHSSPRYEPGPTTHSPRVSRSYPPPHPHVVSYTPSQPSVYHPVNQQRPIPQGHYPSPLPQQYHHQPPRHPPLPQYQYPQGAWYPQHHQHTQSPSQPVAKPNYGVPGDGYYAHHRP